MTSIMWMQFENPKRKIHKIHMNKSPTRYLKNMLIKHNTVEEFFFHFFEGF
jgi:hypothetical protein